MSPETLSPSLATLVKLASIAVHAEEAISDDGHDFDVVAIRSLLSDPEVRGLLADMDKAALLPKMRRGQ